MEPAQRKIAIIIVVVIALCVSLLSIVKMIPNSKKGDFIPVDAAVWFKCIHSDCAAVYSLSGEEFQKFFQDPQTAIMPGQQVFPCRQCGQFTASIAQKCEKCGEVFITNERAMQYGSYPDTCPRCAYSPMEEKLKK